MTTAIRGSDVWLKEDIRSMLAAILVTNQAAAVAMGTTSEYNAGFNACMVAVLVTFGLQPHIVTNGGNHELG